MKEIRRQKSETRKKSEIRNPKKRVAENPFGLRPSDFFRISAFGLRISRFPKTIVFTSLLICAGCAVGPNFKKPAAPQLTEYTATPLSATSVTTNIAGGESQRFFRGGDIPGEWWTLFHSKQLNDLIELSLSNNPT